MGAHVTRSLKINSHVTCCHNYIFAHVISLRAHITVSNLVMICFELWNLVVHYSRKVEHHAVLNNVSKVCWHTLNMTGSPLKQSHHEVVSWFPSAVTLFLI